MIRFLSLLAILMILRPYSVDATQQAFAVNHNEILGDRIYFMLEQNFSMSTIEESKISEFIVSSQQAFKENQTRLLSTSRHRVFDIQEGFLKSGTNPEEAARELRKLPGIKWAEPVPVPHVFHTPNDPDFSQQAYLSFLDATAAWQISKGDSSIVIAIVDTGVDYQHPDLFPDVWVNPNETLNGQDDSGSGFIDDIHGWDFFENNNNPRPSQNAHGTHVAGIAAAATNNGIGIASLGYNTRFMALKSGDGVGSGIPFAYQAVIYAAEQGADIINCSWGSTRFSRAAEMVIDYATELGSLVVAAAGNANTPEIYYPAGYNNVIAVGSNDLNGTKSAFSSYGPFVSVSAPGNGIRSTLLQNQYGNSSGTSMAAPVVSALAALIKAANPEFSNDQIRAQIQATTRSMQTMNDHQFQTGTGSIHPPSALGNPVPFVEIFDYRFSDTRGNNNGQLEPNEDIELQLLLRGFGLADPFTIQFSSPGNILIPQQSSITVEPIAQGDSLLLVDIPFRVSGQALDRFDLRAILKMDFLFEQGTEYYRTIQEILNPSFYTFNDNSIFLTVGSEGQIGFLDGPGGDDGIPFVLPGESSETLDARDDYFNKPLLFEGGLMFGNNLGSSDAFVSNAVRGAAPGLVDRDFLSREPFRIQELSNPEGTRARVTFTDGNAGSNQYGITVTKTAYAFRDIGHERYVLLEYSYLNTSQNNYSSFISGLFLDFDALPSKKNNNVGRYIEEDEILLVAEHRNYETDEQAFLLGVSVISGIHTPFVIDNSGAEGFFGISDGFTMRDKALSLRGGKISTQRGFNTQFHSNGTDISVVAAHAPVQLAQNQTHKEVFILAWGLGYEDLRSNISAARDRYLQISSTENDDSIPTQSQITSAYPNPFNTITNIAADIHQSGNFSLTVHDILGRELVSLHQGTLHQGQHVFTWNADRFASGMYIIRLQSQDGVLHTKKISLIK